MSGATSSVIKTGGCSSITFYMDFVLHLCKCGLCGCELVLYVDLLFNRIDKMLCGCGLVLDVYFFGMRIFLFT